MNPEHATKQANIFSCAVMQLVFISSVYLSITLPTFAQTNTLTSFKFELSKEAQEAINNGVTLTFNCDFAVRQSYWLFTTEKQNKHHQFLLVRQALSGRYIVKQDTLDTPHLFRTVSEASNYIAAHATALLDTYNDSQHQYSMRLYLNKYKLPGPMRLNAFISDEWNLDTGWMLWLFVT